MAFRTVVVNSRCKLEHKLNYLIIRGENEKRIYLNEINTLIVQSTAVSLTASLLSELVKNNVKVIFCDEKYNPQSELIPYYGAHNTSKRYKFQLAWKQQTKDKIWKIIIQKKILNQAEYLLKQEFCQEAEMLKTYAKEVCDGDITNREGHAAKVYFNCVMPEGTTRNSGGFINGALNYGYAVLLSAFNREIVSSGYLTQLGVWHDNEFNQFNLSCDLMEPFRFIVDETAFGLENGDKLFKKKMANILNYETVFGGKITTLDIAIRLYVRSFFDSMELDDVSLLAFPTDIKIENEQ